MPIQAVRKIRASNCRFGRHDPQTNEWVKCWPAPLVEPIGPITIAKVANQSFVHRLGSGIVIYGDQFKPCCAQFGYYPYPMLDGGHIVMYAIWGYFGKPAGKGYKWWK